MAVHLPLVLLLVWPLLEALGWALKRPDLSLAGALLLGLNVVASLLAVATGEAAFQSAIAAGHPPARLLAHAEIASKLPWLVIATFGLWLWARLSQKAGIRALALVLGLTGAILAVGVGRSGGILVYTHGVGVSQDR